MPATGFTVNTNCHFKIESTFDDKFFTKLKPVDLNFGL